MQSIVQVGHNLYAASRARPQRCAPVIASQAPRRPPEEQSGQVAEISSITVTPRGRGRAGRCVNRGTADQHFKPANS
jgi:hypothetical protein